MFQKIQWGDAQSGKVAWANNLKSLDKRGKRTCALEKTLCCTTKKGEESHGKLYIGRRC